VEKYFCFPIINNQSVFNKNKKPTSSVSVFWVRLWFLPNKHRAATILPPASRRRRYAGRSPAAGPPAGRPPAAAAQLRRPPACRRCAGCSSVVGSSAFRRPAHAACPPAVPRLRWARAACLLVRCAVEVGSRGVRRRLRRLVRITMGLAWIGMPDVDGVSIDLMTPGPEGLQFGPLGLAHEWEMAASHVALVIWACDLGWGFLIFSCGLGSVKTVVRFGSRGKPKPKPNTEIGKTRNRSRTGKPKTDISVRFGFRPSVKKCPALCVLDCPPFLSNGLPTRLPFFSS
jgi:hypothetical protein